MTLVREKAPDTAAGEESKKITQVNLKRHSKGKYRASADAPLSSTDIARPLARRLLHFAYTSENLEGVGLSRWIR